MKYGLRDLPTELLPVREEHSPGVTLTTSKHQELFMFERPTYRGKPGTRPHDDKENYADMDPNGPTDYPEHPFYRSEAASMFEHLPEVRPKTFYIFGGDSTFDKTKEISPPETWNLKVERTGVGVGGGGGVKYGQVKQAVVPNAGHLVLFEKVEESAGLISEYLGQGLKQWRARNEAFQKAWVQKDRVQKSTIDDRWRENVDPNKSAGKPKL